MIGIAAWPESVWVVWFRRPRRPENASWRANLRRGGFVCPTNFGLLWWAVQFTSFLGLTGLGQFGRLNPLNHPVLLGCCCRTTILCCRRLVRQRGGARSRDGRTHGTQQILSLIVLDAIFGWIDVVMYGSVLVPEVRQGGLVILRAVDLVVEFGGLSGVLKIILLACPASSP